MFLLLAVEIMLLSCKKRNCEIQIIDTRTIGGLSMYAIYSSDTCWQDMISFTDSLTIKNKETAHEHIAIFLYPKDSIPKFEENSFSVYKNPNNYYILMKAYDTSISSPPYEVVKYPERYIKAKQAEKTNNN